LENYIKHIDIKNLWGLYDIAFNCNKGVNILVGKNGSGKSTILKMIESGLEILSDEKNTSVVFFNFFHKNVPKSKRKKFDSYNHVNIRFFNFTVLKYKLIDTFDIAVRDKRKIGKTTSILDFELSDLINTYFVKLESIYNSKALNHYKNQEPSAGDEITKKLDDFYNILNSFFSDSNKKIIFTQEKKFIFENGNGTIDISQLSSGEKHLLIILINIFLLEEEQSIVLMDEPELTLDILWQERLIETIFKINPNVQLFVTTHSSSIFFNGLGDKMIDLDNPQIKNPAKNILKA